LNFEPIEAPTYPIKQIERQNEFSIDRSRSLASQYRRTAQRYPFSQENPAWQLHTTKLLLDNYGVLQCYRSLHLHSSRLHRHDLAVLNSEDKFLQDEFHEDCKVELPYGDTFDKNFKIGMMLGLESMGSKRNLSSLRLFNLSIFFPPRDENT